MLPRDGCKHAAQMQQAAHCITCMPIDGCLVVTATVVVAYMSMCSLHPLPYSSQCGLVSCRFSINH
jgi:hypothetical protein